MRVRPAPRARRTLVSRWRRAPRASISVAMFAHASSSTSARKIISTVSGAAKSRRWPNRPRLPSRSTSLGVSSPARSGNIVRTIADSCVSSAACAAPSLTPGLARPRMCTAIDVGFASQFRPSDDGVTIGAFASAIVTAGVCDGSVLAAPVNRFGFTPTMITATSLSRMARPTTFGCRWNADSQNSSLITATASLPAVSSDGSIARPRCG